MTFSNEAAREFKQRLYDLELRNRPNVFLGTVHSFCISEIIQPFAHLYPQYKIPLPLKIIPKQIRDQLFEQVRQDLEVDKKSVSIFAMDSERTLNIDGVSKVDIPSFDVGLRMALEYEKRLEEYGFVDFVSIIKFATILIQNESYVRKCLEAKFPWICIDEYQDLGRPLHEMILSLCRNTDIRFFVVGDPDQSIYGFGGALPDYLLELCNEPGIVTVQLQTNYRSNQDIIDASEIALGTKDPRNYVAGTRQDERAKFFFTKCNADMEEQYAFVAKKIIPHCTSDNIPLGEIAVLVRTNQELVHLSDHLRDMGIPYYASRHNFERTHIVTWLEDCAQWLLKSKSISFESLYLFWRQVRTRHERPISKLDEMHDKRQLYQTLIDSLHYRDNLARWLANLIAKLELNDLLKHSEVYPDEVKNLSDLLNVCNDGPFKNAGIEKFSKLGKPENQVTVSTRHASKGLEFEAVALLGMEDGNFPWYRNIWEPRKLAEERRIFFVCISRAKSRCYFVRSNRINGYTKEPSRFLVELRNWYKAFKDTIE